MWVAAEIAGMSGMMNGARGLLEQLIQGDAACVRFTQDSPMLPDTLIQFGMEGGAQDLLLIPNWKSSSATLVSRLSERLAACPPRPGGGLPEIEARIALTQSTVAAKLTFDEVLAAALPLTGWWQGYLIVPEDDPLTLYRNPSTRPHLEKALINGLRSRGRDSDHLISLKTGRALTVKNSREPHLTTDLLWLVTVAGTLRLLLADMQGQGLSSLDDSEAKRRLQQHRDDPAALVAAFFALLDITPPIQDADRGVLWSVNRNRTGKLAMVRSTATVKADAARRVFNVTGAGIHWAIVDTGVDASHLAFRRRNKDGTIKDEPWEQATRVIDAFDFSLARTKLLALDEARPALTGDAVKDAEARGAHVRRKLTELRGVNWSKWTEELRIPRDAGPPANPHGTHVAGILAADWHPDDSDDDALGPAPLLSADEQRRTGVCPEIEIYDIRVANDDGEYDEFALIAALQFIRAFNAMHEHVEIHGVNLSLSIPHDVANFACGRTPVCEECTRLVASGVVVVAAAGNLGHARYLTMDGKPDDGYRAISITDPGNADAVITVGATHRMDPHGYGVSYFSSRGPTGDGRAKPDLVAPGEKVVSTLPNNREDAMDGTSMAAPHVSGAAALLLSRHGELIGRPAEVKKILCSTAVDLGRERYFQGAGLVDILHALESA